MTNMYAVGAAACVAEAGDSEMHQGLLAEWIGVGQGESWTNPGSI